MEFKIMGRKRVSCISDTFTNEIAKSDIIREQIKIVYRQLYQ